VTPYTQAAVTSCARTTRRRRPRATIRAVHRRSLLPATVALAIAASACSFSGLSFRTDERLTITDPDPREEVRLPVTVRWDVEDFQVTGETGAESPDAGYFGVYVDRQPQPPGKPLEWFAKDDETCRPADGCPDEEYLAVRGVHATDETEFTIDVLPQPDNENRREFHEVTVVLLNGAGERIGESAFHVDFEVLRDT
jgi:hypothetical protein